MTIFTISINLAKNVFAVHGLNATVKPALLRLSVPCARLGGWQLRPLHDVLPRTGVAHDRLLHLNVGTQGELATLDNALSGLAAFFPSRARAVESSGASGAKCARGKPRLKSTAQTAACWSIWAGPFGRWSTLLARGSCRG